MSHHASGPNFGFPRGDARLDMTDLYAFTKPGDPAKSIIVLNVHPSFALDLAGADNELSRSHPGALYEVKIDTNGDAIADICLQRAVRIFERRKADCDSSPYSGRASRWRGRGRRSYRRATHRSQSGEKPW